MVLYTSFRDKISRALFSVFSFFDKSKCFIHTSIKNSLSLSDSKRATERLEIFSFLLRLFLLLSERKPQKPKE